MDVERELARIDKRASDFGDPSFVEKTIDKRRGTHDGQNDEPQDGRHPYGRVILHHVTSRWSRIAAELRGLTQQLRDQRDRLQHEHETAKADEYERAKEARDAAMDALDRAHGPKSHRLQEAEASAEASEKTAKRLHDELGRDCAARIPLWLYFSLLAGLALLEWPINQQAFSQVVPGLNVASAFTALLVGGFVAGTAHIIGDWLQRARRYPGWRHKWPFYAGSAGLVALTSALFYFIALLRQATIALEQAQNSDIAAGGLDTLLQNQTAASFLSQGLDMRGIAMLALNFAVLGIGVALSVKAHDPEPSYPRALRAKHRAERRRRKLRRRYEKRANDVWTRHTQHLSEIANRLRGICHDIEDVDTQLARIERLSQDIARRAADYASARIAQYEDANMRARTTAQPDRFETFTAERIYEELTNHHDSAEPSSLSSRRADDRPAHQPAADAGDEQVGGVLQLRG
jgi:hypothetical protein